METGKPNIGDFGDEISHLHERLVLHGVEISAEERKRNFFGPSTREAVGEFQKIGGIDPSCEVCKQTAQLLAATPPITPSAQSDNPIWTLTSNTDLEQKETSARSCLPLAIAAPLRMGDRSAEVVNLQAGLILIIDNQFLRINTEEQKLYREELLQEQKEQIYNDYTAKIISIFQKQSQLNPTGEVDQATEAALNRVLQDLGLSACIEVRGRLTDINKRGLPKYIVSLSEYDLTGTVQIARCISEDDGTFKFNFDNNKALKKGDDTTAPDLVFQIFDPNRTEQSVMAIFTLAGEQEIAVPRLSESLQAPIVLMNVPSSLVLRIVADLHQRLLTEFEQLVARLSPFMQQVGFADLKEDEANFQISFLSKESGIEKTKIEQLRDAFKQEHEFDSVPAWAFFGLASQNISLGSVALMPLDELVSVLEPLQTTDDQRDLKSVANALKQFAQEHNIQTQITNLKTSVGDLLQPILASETKLNTFLDAYARHEGEIEDFWQVMSQNRDFQAEVPKIQLNLQLSQLTLNNRGLIDALQRKGIKNIRQLVDLPAQDWEALALEHKTDMPSHITGENDLARAKIYAQKLQTLVELAFPTDVIKKTIQQLEVNTFLSNNPEFDFTRTPVDAYLHEQGEQALQGIAQPEAVKKQLRQTQRLYTITANTANMNVLMEMKYESAHQIAKLSVDDFSQSLSGRISAENAYVYHAKALAVSDASVMVYHQLRDLAGSHSFKVAKNLKKDLNVSPDQDIPNIDAPFSFKIVNNPNGNGDAILPGIPNWESLFGSIDTCECQHCKSVYSPAAYFVDLLHILLGQQGRAARKEIFRRRPDLMYTKLSCEHTEILIPYIDLVNEVLEIYVAQDHVGDVAAKSHAEASTNDTSGFTASDLAANPQHPNEKADDDAKNAYKLLKEATFPLKLPFDMDLEVARQFLQEQNSSRFNVMKTYGNATSYATAAERLGISNREFEILTLKKLDGTSDAPNVFVSALWGNPTIPIGQTLGKNTKIFLEYTSITYLELIDLLKTRFLNPNFPINVYLQDLSETERNSWLAAHPTEDQLALQVIELGGDPKAPCDLSKTQIKHLNGEFLSDVELSRFNRFIRLWKKLGCTIAQLDRLLMAIDTKEITPQVIQDLSGLWQVQQDLDLSLDRVAVLIGNIPALGKDSLFAKLFLNKAILQIDPIFILNVYQTELEKNTALLQDHVPAILAAMQISEEDLNRIVVYTNLNLATDTVNLANLSKIYRYVIFAKGLRIKIEDLIVCLGLMAQAPWGSVADLVKTKERLEKLNRYGFKASDFAYIFNDEIVAGNMLPPKDEIIHQSIKTLREGLLKIRQENSPKDGIVTAGFLKIRLGILFDEGEVTKIIGILDESNTQNKFSYLLTPQVPDNYKDILQNYLTPADVNDLATTTDIPERFRKYWDKIEAKLLPVLRETFVQQYLIATFKADAALAAFFLQDATVLQTCLDVETDTPTHNTAYIDLYVLMYKCLWLIGTLKLSAKELTYFQNNANFSNFNWRVFNFVAWLQVADFVDLRNALPVAKQDLLSVFEAAKSGGDIAKAIIEVTAWDKANVEYFVSKLTATDFLNEISLIRLQKQIELSQQIGVSAKKLESWANDTVTHEQSQDVKRSLKTKYDESAWIEISTQVHNRLRSHLRNALVAYLLQKPEIKALGLKDTNDLYSYFLIDVEMDSCMLTSRLKQAIASVQLFVQRCLLNLESNKADPAHIILPTAIDANQWKWMKNYRVWEANRKVFLYPENWIEPELRDNKSPFFKELESELLQGEVTNESVEKALINYLEKLHDVARLDICGIYEDTEGQELHVFGRTFNSPPQYFYRKLDIKTQVWTAWEKISVDVQGNEEGDSAGVHLMPVVWNRRLYLFWPIFTEKSDKEKIKQDRDEYKSWKQEHDRWVNNINNLRQEKKRLAEQGIGNTKSEANYGPEPIEPSQETYPWAYYEVRLAWSEYKNKKWSNKKVSQSFIRTESGRYGVAATNFYRFSLILESSLRIKLLYHPSMLIPVGEYQLNCNGRVNVLSNEEAPLQIAVINPKQVNFYQGYLSAKSSGREIKWYENNSLPLELFDNNGKNKKKILSSSEDEYKLLFPADHDFSYNNSSRFIYQDHKRNYYVEPEFYVSHKSLQEPNKLVIPQLITDFSKLFLSVNKGYPVPLKTADKFKQVSSAEINKLVENKQIDVSTSMQIRSSQTLAAPSFVEMGTRSLSFPVAEVETPYFASRFFTNTKLRFKPFFHAYICKFMDSLEKDGIESLLNLFNQQFSDLQVTFTSGGIAGGQIPTGITNNFVKIYGPNKDNVDTPYPIEEVDFSPGGAYSLYNWELFFHVPMLLANRLNKNQRFEEAMRWYHFIFNPTTNDSLSTSARYWQVILLRNTPKETLDQLFDQLKLSPSNPNRKAFEDAITAWRNDPFKPHLIARMRLIAYQKNTVMKYLDNLIAWADNLFRQDTIESINEATQLYILAAEILGKRPEKIPARDKIQALNYAELEKEGIDAFSNIQVKLETIFPFYNLQPIQQGAPGTASVLSATAPTWYFCLPENDKLLGYWDTVADRLFKIRHCQNIEGIERQLALFEPPIDPALLVQAVAGGVDISSVLADLNSPLPHYRFNYIVPKALEICGELKSLGNSLLSALEKKDGETLSMMRTQHETLLLDLAKTVKKLQITEAKLGREGLEKTRAVTEHRANFYTQVLKDGLNSSEKEHRTLSFVSMALSLTGQGFETAAALAQPVPDTEVGAIAGATGGPTNNNRVAGGDKTAKALSAFGRFFNMLSTMSSYAANAAQTNAGYQRRAADWKLQQDIANKELAQIDKQILAAQIREKISEQELVNHEQQIENARQVEDFYRNKFTQEELYGWMVGEISTIYFQCYQLAYDLAKKAEKTYRYELGLPTSNFVQFGIWDSFRKGLMSGERLYLSLKQMEKSFMDQNRREYEIAKHISLLQLKPVSLIALKETGTCLIELSETLFDADYPGHYMRRLKNVSLTIPCVVGPYTSINCTLTLLSSETRIKSISASPYKKKADGDDPRFITNYAAMQSIATSTAQNDSGLFELNFRDERYLPFEGAGAISRWRIDLPKDCNAFDFDTISDVILRLNYTAREGGKMLKNDAQKAMQEAIKDAELSPLTRFFSAKHEFSNEWHRFLNPAEAANTQPLKIDLSLERFPFQFRGKRLEISKVEFFLNLKEGIKPGTNKSYDEMYASGTPLNVAVTPPSVASVSKSLNSSKSFLNGIPYVLFDKLDVEVKSGNDALWSLTAIMAPIKDDISDLFIVCYYSVS